MPKHIPIPTTLTPERLEMVLLSMLTNAPQHMRDITIDGIQVTLSCGWDASERLRTHHISVLINATGYDVFILLEDDAYEIVHDAVEVVGRMYGKFITMWNEQRPEKPMSMDGAYDRIRQLLAYYNK